MTLGNRVEEPFDRITFITLGTKAGEIPAQKVRTRLAVVDASVEHFVAEPPLAVLLVDVQYGSEIVEVLFSNHGLIEIGDDLQQREYDEWNDLPHQSGRKFPFYCVLEDVIEADEAHPRFGKRPVQVPVSACPNTCGQQVDPRAVRRDPAVLATSVPAPTAGDQGIRQPRQIDEIECDDQVHVLGRSMLVLDPQTVRNGPDDDDIRGQPAAEILDLTDRVRLFGEKHRHGSRYSSRS